MLPARWRSARMLSIAGSISAWRWLASGTRRAIARPVPGDDDGLAALYRIEELGQAGLPL
jgi:hypothetical protein